MFEVNVNVKIPDLLAAATMLAEALKPNTAPKTSGPAAPTAAPSSAPAPAPVQQFQAPTAAPTTPAPGITLPQVSKAGADLIAADPGKMPQLLALLQQFSVPAITELKPEQIGPFATALRGLGAKI